LAVWIVPMVTFGVVVITVMPGYVLCYFPSLAILAGLALSRLAGRIARALSLCKPYGLGIVIGVITLANVAMFLLPPKQTTWLRANLPLTATHIRDHDRQLGGWFQAIRKRFRPDEILICHEGQSYFWGIRQFEYHLPEYENCLLTTDSALLPPLDKKLWVAKDWHVDFVDRLDGRGRKELILVVPLGSSLDAFTNALDVARAKRWDIPQSPPLFTLEPPAGWFTSTGSGAN
jgi:hypothetical protein